MSQSINQRIQACLAAFLAVLATSCETQRVEMSEVRSSFGFDSATWGGQGGDSDEDKLKKKYAEKGWKLDDKGNVVGKDLYSENSFRKGKGIDKKEARLKQRETSKEVFRTPEYLERQQARTKSAKDGKLVARNADFDGNRAAEFGQENRQSKADTPGFMSRLNPFRGKSARETGQTYRTSRNPEIARAQANIAVPNPGKFPRNGDQRSAAMTMDDVKKMLHPEAFD